MTDAFGPLLTVELKDVFSGSAGTVTRPAFGLTLLPARTPPGLLPRPVADALKSQAAKHNLTHGKDPARRADAEALRAVYRRGAASFDKPRHPNLSRRQWGMRRVSAHLAALAGGGARLDHDLLPSKHPEHKPSELNRKDLLVIEGMVGLPRPAEVKATMTLSPAHSALRRGMVSRFDPTKHPRDLHGRFAAVMGNFAISLRADAGKLKGGGDVGAVAGLADAAEALDVAKALGSHLNVAAVAAELDQAVAALTEAKREPAFHERSVRTRETVALWEARLARLRTRYSEALAEARRFHKRLTVGLETKRVVWDPHKHPRDKHGRFASLGAVVSTVAGKLGEVVGQDGKGNIDVRTEGGKVERVAASSTEVVQAAPTRELPAHRIGSGDRVLGAAGDDKRQARISAHVGDSGKVVRHVEPTGQGATRIHFTDGTRHTVAADERLDVHQLPPPRGMPGPGDVTRAEDIHDRLVDYRADRRLSEPEKQRQLAELLPNTRYVPYGEVPFLDDLNRRMGVDTDTAGSEEYVAARKRLFESLATSHVPFDRLVVTQPTVNTDGIAKLQSGENPIAGKPGFFVRYHGETYVMDGHHRLAVDVLEGSDGVDGKLLDLDSADRPGDAPAHPDGREWGEGYSPSDPRNDPDYDRYTATLDARLEKAYAEHGDTETMFDRVEDAPGKYRRARELVHEEILDEWEARFTDVPKEWKAVVLAGPMGAGKTTTMRVSGHEFGVESHTETHPDGRETTFPTNFALVGGDELKESLIAKGALPEEYRRLGIADLETAELLHEESSMLAKRLQSRLTIHGTNVILDGTYGGDLVKQVGKAQVLRSAGYTVTGVLVDGDIEKSLENAGKRHRNASDPKSSLERGLTGRYIMTDVIAEQRPSGGWSEMFGRPHRSRSSENFEAASRQVFDGGIWVYDNASGSSRLVHSSGPGALDAGRATPAGNFARPAAAIPGESDAGPFDADMGGYREVTGMAKVGSFVSVQGQVYRVIGVHQADPKDVRTKVYELESPDGQTVEVPARQVEATLEPIDEEADAAAKIQRNLAHNRRVDEQRAARRAAR